tara:strand:+ start:642 stop:878 length:237 start_codon:yes stop_codon:yes gene_type:complete
MRKKIKRILDRVHTIKNNTQDIEETKQQYETPIKVDRNIPRSAQGKDGDRKVVKEGNDNYLYIKVEGRWMKTQLQEVR